MRALVLVLVLVACGTDAMTVELAMPGDTYYFKTSIGDAGWRSPPGKFDGISTTYELTIDGDFELVRVCEHRDGTFIASELFGTLDDATVTIGTWHVPACLEDPSPSLDATVTGKLDSPGVITIGGMSAVIQDANEPFTLPISPGVHDITIVNSNFEAVIRHDVELTSIDLGTLATHGSRMLTDNYTASLTASEAATAYTELATRNGTSSQLRLSPKMAVFVSADQLAFGDLQTYHFVAVGEGTVRTAVAGSFATTPPPFELLSPVGQFAWDHEHAVTWTPITDFYSTASLELADPTGSQIATASKLWLDRHDASQLTFDVDPPGFRWHTIFPEPTVMVELWSPGLVLQTSTSHVY